MFFFQHEVNNVESAWAYIFESHSTFCEAIRYEWFL